MKNTSKYKVVIALVAVVTIFAGASAYASEATSTRASSNHRPMMNRPLLPKGEMMKKGRGMMGTSTRPMMKGDEGKEGAFLGRPVLGKIATLNGSSFTLTDPKGTTFTVDATSAKIIKRGDTPNSGVLASSTVSDLVVGQNVVVFGEVATSTNTVSAKQVILGVPAPQIENKDQGAQVSSSGFFHKIGSFFGKLFGR